MVLSGGATEKIRDGPGTFRLVAQCLNHYATPGASYLYYSFLNNDYVVSCDKVGD